MKKKMTYALLAGLLLSGFFGLAAISESHLPFWESLFAILGICAAELPVILILNKMAEKEERV